MRRLDVKNACPRADGFVRDAYRCAPSEWGPPGVRRIWLLKALAYGPNDAPAAFHRTLNGRLLQERASLVFVALKFRVSALHQRPFSAYRSRGGDVEAWPHIDDVRGCGWRGELRLVRKFSEHCFGHLEVQENNFTLFGAELPEAGGFSVQLTQKKFTNVNNPWFLWASRQSRF